MVPLFAVDFGDVVKLLVVFFVFVVPVIGQLIAKMKQMPPPEKRPIPPKPPLPEVHNEIEEFLRRKAQRRPAEPQRPTIILQTPAPEPVRAQTVPKTAKSIGSPLDEPVLLEEPVGGQLSEHVKRYLDESDMSRREAELGQQVAQADREIDQRLRQKFDHRVSKLEAVPGEAAAPPVAYEPPDLVGASADIPASFATGLLDLLSNPDSLRQAIVLNEILHRPEERWA
jgi:hypothetical protein